MAVVAITTAARDESVSFRFEDAGAKSVALAGEFNNWKPDAMERDSQGAWTKTLELVPGTYGYKFIVDGKIWLNDPVNPARKTVGGLNNSAVVVGDGVFRESTGPKEWTFTYTDGGAREVFVAGSFNGWNTTANPLRKNEGGVWTTTVQLPPGETSYKFIVDGQWRTDPGNPKLVPDGRGGSNSAVTIESLKVLNDKALVSFRHTARGFTGQMRSWLEQKRFADLEKIASELRTSQARWSSGVWKLDDFYAAVSAGKDEYEKIAPLLDEWIKEFPDSITPRVAKAESLAEYAWDARGRGWAEEVKPEAWPVFKERLLEAQKVVEDARKLPVKDPALDRAMQTVHLGRGGDFGRESYEALFSAAVAAFPDYYDYYFAKATYLLPRWYGEPGEWEKFAESAAASSPEGNVLYTRIAWATSHYYDNIFKETEISWPKMRQGFEAMMKAWPDSKWNLSAFLKFAIQARDFATARGLLKQIGDEPDILAWGTPGRWRESMRMLTEGAATPPLSSWKMPGTVGSIAVMPDGKKFAAITWRGWLAIFSVGENEPEFAKEFAGEGGAHVAVSPDGKWLAAAFRPKDAPAKVRVFELPRMSERVIIDDWKGEVSRLIFTPDSRTLLVTGGVFNSEGRISLWDVDTGKVTPLVEGALPNGFAAHAALSPDAKLLALADGQTLSVWDFPGRKIIKRIPQNIGGWVIALAFSPDGKTLAELSGSGQNNNSRDSRFFLWDTGSWNSREIPLDCTGGGPIRLAFAPDGKSIATAGFDYIVRLWNPESGKETASFFGHQGAIQSIAFLPDGKKLLSGSRDDTILLWDVTASKEK